MRINNIPVRWVSQRFGANYADPYPGVAGDTILLWRTDAHDSQAEVRSRTLSDAAGADRLQTLGPRGVRCAMADRAQ